MELPDFIMKQFECKLDMTNCINYKIDSRSVKILNIRIYRNLWRISSLFTITNVIVLILNIKGT